jgi:cytochrome c6
MNKNTKFSLIYILFFLTFPKQIDAMNLEKGGKLFRQNCLVCHENGNNRIIGEKNLKKESLETNGKNSIDSISYQLTNGKNGMPAFGGRLKEKDIEEIAEYILYQSAKNFEKDY